MNKQLLSKTGLILAVILFIAFIIVVNGNFKSARVDLTEDKLYTLSEGTLNILSSLQQPITLRFYYSEQVAQALPSLKAYAQRVQELLMEYQRASDGMIQVKIINPKPFTDHEQRAKQYGLQSIPIEGEPDPLFFGVAGTNILDGLERIRFFQPEMEDVLEYDLTRMVYQLSDVERKNVAVMSSLPIDGEDYDPLKGQLDTEGGAKPWAVMGKLREMFNVSVLPEDIRRIPSSVDLLMVVHPKELPEQTLYAIDQYVLQGGKLITFVDPYAEVDVPEKDPDNPMAAMVANRSSNMPELLNTWGVERDASDVVADRKTAREVDFGAQSNNQPIEYVLWNALTQENMNSEQRITSKLRKLNVATAGHFKILDDKTTEVTPLLSSSDEAMLVDKRVVQFRNDPVALLTKYQQGTISYPLAVRIQGKSRSAFPDGVKADGGKMVKMPDHVNESQNGIDVIAIADVDMLDDRFWVIMQDFYGEDLAFNTSNNIDFVHNAIEELTGAEGLISVRSRTGFTRPFVRVEALQREAERLYRAKERELENKLQQTRQRIARMQVERNGSGAEIMTPEQQKEIAEFRAIADRTELELRAVKGNLRKDIDQLETLVKFINIGLIPIVVAILALITGWLRVRKRTRGRFQS
ncbi:MULTISPECIES: Gldg family protein [unclassified Methylophaga]|jgi:gliding motility-associatede transport system auxiliary component|uniref:Gldg family protein n=3 Tax=Methylophaga TaxID=40222 RepID=UPI000C43038E|nr:MULTISPECIES: Gldg family protein [unclassified Methylophaga]MAL50618.1 gliding motility protein GldG [Methylophaga sp.]MBP25804.1 gliding motility protein GldG [Methylophaga sp.]HAD30564.1 gliding motility protein GldG [Methylophaga sp.]|tara:strand:- start:3276 stop:5189 length:1914 start_codon:yes stop_codon:yes gene_type:complete